METLCSENLGKSFDGVTVLDDVSVRLGPTGIAAIVGPNGAGKTTLLNILTGFIEPDAGQCFVGKQEITRWRAFEVARLGIARTFQELRLIRQISVLDCVMLGCPNQRGDMLLCALLRIGVSREERANRQKAMAILGLVGLAGRASDMAGEQSYGQQKLLSIACCLATEAHIMLFDEPVAGVQPDMVEHILNLLRSLRDTGKLIVFIEHDLAAVRKVADNLIVMDHGCIIAQGAPAEVLERREIMEAYIA